MHDVVSEVLKNTIRKIPFKNLFLVGKSNNYFLLFIRRMSANEKNIAEKVSVSFSFLESECWLEIFFKKMVFRIGVLPKMRVMKTKTPGQVKQQRN